jgi:hypothetical protein
MINREARNVLIGKLSQVLRDESASEDLFIYDIEGLPDRAVSELQTFGNMIVPCDYAFHSARKVAQTQELMEVVQRCILFLQTDLDFEWPAIPVKRSLQWIFISLVICEVALTLALFAFGYFSWTLFGVAGAALLLTLLGQKLLDLQTMRTYWRSGSKEIWPFTRQSDFHQAAGQS